MVGPFARLLILTTISLSSGNGSLSTDVIHQLTQGTWRMCLDTSMCEHDLPHCPHDRERCCRSCVDLCETVGGNEEVNVSAYEELECNISRESPTDWSEPSHPFILSIFDSDEAEKLVSWELFESALNTPVKVMNRPQCGSNFQDAAASYIEVDLSEFTAVVQSAHGDGVMAQMRMMRFRKNDPHHMDYSTYDGDRLAFWEERTTEQAGDFAERLYQSLLSSPKFINPLHHLGLKPEEDYHHARYSAIWMSTGGSRTAMHFDPWPSILYQFQGIKYVVVGAPDDEAFLPGRVNVGYPHTHGGGLLHRLPNSTHPYTCLLRPGEMLYIPPGWRHDIYTVEPSISVGVRLPQWTPEVAASNMKQDTEQVSLILFNHRKEPATLWWIPSDGSPPKLSGKVKAANSQVSKESRRTFMGHSFKVQFGDGLVFGPFIVGNNDMFMTTVVKEDENAMLVTVSELQLPLAVSFTVSNCPTAITVTDVKGHQFLIQEEEGAERRSWVLSKKGNILACSCGTAKHHSFFTVHEDKQNFSVVFNEEM